VPDAGTAVMEAITALIEGRDDSADADDVEVTPEARLYEDLRLDSLELAELSESLGQVFGRDPYTDGLAPVTVGDVIAYYES
jgi:acyl carrier protein